MTYQKYIPREVDPTAHVWICEDHEGLRATAAEVISDSADLCCPVSVGSMEKLLRELDNPASHPPDVILLDLGLPGMSGLDGIDAIRSRVSDCKIVVFTVANDEQNTFQALQNGVDGYLLKDESISRIPDFIHEVMSGGSPMSRQIVRLMLNRFKKTEEFIFDTSGDRFKLSELEKSIILLCSHGMIKKDITEALGITYHRVDYYMRMIFKKMSVSTIHGAVGKAFREGIIARVP